MARIKAFAIFEGGGARGIAHAGALKAAEEGYEFIGVAGTSAGAIVAALVAAGYEADEIYSPGSTAAVLSGPLTDLLEPAEWATLRTLRDRVSSKRQQRSGERVSLMRRLSPWGPHLLMWPCLLIGLVDALSGVDVNKYGFAWLGLGGGVLLWMYSIRTRLFWVFSAAHLGIAFMLSGFLSGPYVNCVRKGGLATTDKFEKWLNSVLLAKVRANNISHSHLPDGHTVLFSDLRMPLKIIAADVETHSVHVFQAKENPSVGVAEAVCASVSIPVVFAPKIIHDRRYVDGGIMSNFPAWVFDDERDSAPLNTPTIGFRLVANPRSGDPRADESGVLRYFGQVAYSAAFGDNSLETRKVAGLTELPVQVKIGVLDFDAESETKNEVYRWANLQAKDFFDNKVHPVSSDRLDAVLGMVEKVIRQHLKLKEDCHLRLNVMRPLDDKRLQVVCGRNMAGDLDTDDRLILGKLQGAAGECWQTRRPVVCDLVKAKAGYASRWRMDKYQQRLVRDDLRSLLCLPLTFRRKVPDDHEFVGVLCVDSREELTEQFKAFIDESWADISACCQLVVQTLRDWRGV